jgi:hypothetical protein
MKGKGPNTTFMLVQDLAAIARLEILEANGLVVAPTGNGLSIWAECYSPDAVTVACECSGAYFGSNIPDFYSQVSTAGNQGATIVTDSNGTNPVIVGLPMSTTVSGMNIPKAHVPSSPPLTRVCPSGRKAIAQTQLV